MTIEAAPKITTVDQALELIQQRDLKHVRVGAFDMDGILRGKLMSIDKFVSAIDKGFGFCDVVLGWDSADELYDNVTKTGWHTGYPDAEVRVLPQTCRQVPWEEESLLFLGEFAGEMESICPRGVLRRVLNRAESMGFKVKAAAEYEFFLFDETPHTLREKDYRDLTPLTPGMFGYSTLRGAVWSELHHEMLELGEIMDFPIEGLHTETGPGVLEAAIKVTDALEAADRAALFKTFIKAMAQRHGLIASFMSKWSMDYPGQSGHLHVSLTDTDGRPVFYDEKQDNRMSETMRHFVGGQQKLMPDLLAMTASTVNAYTRLIPGFWAPTNANWGIENRTAALRVINSGGAKAARVEYRVAPADANPYLAMAAAIASGLHGVQHGIEPSQPVKGNAYEQEFPFWMALPRTLWDAAKKFKASDAARDLFGKDFVNHFAASREWEEREFRRHVTDWELRRYFEII
ncbi:MAG: glutamine synthetase [Alphaproteobacteria bacterium]